MFAPVEQRVSTYIWNLDQAIVATAVPLSSYRPVSLTVTVGCAQTSAAGKAAVIFSTAATSPAGVGPPPTGLWIGTVENRVDVVLLGRTLLSRSRGELPCGFEVTSTAERSSVIAGTAVLAEWEGDHRPQVAGFFSGLAADTSSAGLSARLVADTRFETSPTPTKIWIAVAAAVCLVGSAVAVAVADRRASGSRTVRLWPARRAVAWALDALVVGVLAVWTLIGPMTVDDGYTTTMVADAARSGYVGGYHHWLNSPEAPFGSFYDGFRLWTQASTELLWLRIPGVVLGVLSWLLLSRLVLPRILPRAKRCSWLTGLASVAFLSAWLPYCNGLRSEPYVVVGMLLTWCCIERGVVTRRLLPVVIGTVVAAMTVTVAPTGLIAPLVLVVAIGPFVRMLRARGDLPWLPVMGVAAGVGLIALLVMFADQTPAALQAGTGVRTFIGPNLPWYQELARYQRLLRTPEVEGSFGRRVPVLLMLLALVTYALLALSWRVRGARIGGVHSGAARRFVLLTALGLAALALTPTKWTHHFGTFAACATVLVVLLAWVGGRGIRSGAGRALLLGGIGFVAALALFGAVTWWFPSAEGIPWGGVPPALRGVPLWTFALAFGAVCTAAGFVLMLRPSWGPTLQRVLPSTALALIVFLTGGLVVQTYGLVRAVSTTSGYTVGKDVLASLAGGRCGLATALQLEPSPAAGVLESTSGPAGVATQAGGIRQGVTSAGYANPYDISTAHQWQAVDGQPGQLTTGWYPLPAAAQTGSSPVVVTAGGAGSVAVVVEFGAQRADGGFEPTTAIELGLADRVSDIRLPVPDASRGAVAVRLRAQLTDGPPDSWISVTAPRVPELVPFTSVYSAGAPALLDWPVAPLMPCQRTATLSGGVAELPAFVLTGGRPEAEATTHSAGGPFAMIKDIADLRPVPTYLDGAPATWSPQIFAVDPRQPLRAPHVDLTTTVVPAWERRPALI
ncbi:MAG: arabinosyltransferase domain-containing protein, partial [Pseudonocardia sp.]